MHSSGAISKLKKQFVDNSKVLTEDFYSHCMEITSAYFQIALEAIPVK